MKVAILGVGHLMHHVVVGMVRGDVKPQITLSVRSTARVEDLQNRFGFQVERDNHKLIAEADVVVIAVRPPDVEATIKDLPWRSDQTVISFAATIGAQQIKAHVNGATVVLGMPTIAAEFGASPTVIYPENAVARDLMQPCGDVISVETEAEYEVASFFGVYCGMVQSLIGNVSGWAENKGLSPEVARSLVAGMTKSGATSVLENKHVSTQQLVEDLSVPGSLTGDAVGVLKQLNAFEPWQTASEKILKRIREG